MTSARYRVDYHTHTYLCHHAAGIPIDYFNAARARGLNELGIADHSPFPVNFDTESRMAPEDWPTYHRIARELQMEGEKQGLIVRMGLECDWVENRMDEVIPLLKNGPMDYVIGSCHYVHDFAYDNPAYRSLWDVQMTDKIWLGYVTIFNAMCQCDAFHILGHMDLPKRFGYFPSPHAARQVRDGFYDAFKSAAKTGLVIEINTSAKRKGLPDYYPSREWIQMAHDCGVGVTFGSDAHAPSDVGFEFDEASELARSVGYTSFATFAGKCRTDRPL